MVKISSLILLSIILVAACGDKPTLKFKLAVQLKEIKDSQIVSGFIRCNDQLGEMLNTAFKYFHAGVVVGDKLFEYDNNGVHISDFKGKEEQYKSEFLGRDYTGKTYMTIQEIEKKVQESDFKPENYHWRSHNSYHFANFVLQLLGAPKQIAQDNMTGGPMDSMRDFSPLSLKGKNYHPLSKNIWQLLIKLQDKKDTGKAMDDFILKSYENKGATGQDYIKKMTQFVMCLHK